MSNKSKQRGESNSKGFPPQHQDSQPGHEHLMNPRPVVAPDYYRGSDKLKGKVAIITGGDSGIGRSTAVLFAKEGASVAIVYLDEDKDANDTKQRIDSEDGRCLLIKGDLGHQDFCAEVVQSTVREFGRLDILVNNAAEQHPTSNIDEITEEQLHKTFRTNIYPMFFLTQASLPHLKEHRGSTIINTTSVTAYRGSPGLLDYSATKGAIVSFTRSLSQKLVSDGIRVNAVAPGPIWTPLIPATFSADKVEKFGTDSPMGRAGQPWECATCYVFLASQDSSYTTGQVLHPNGGEIING